MKTDSVREKDIMNEKEEQIILNIFNKNFFLLIREIMKQYSRFKNTNKENLMLIHAKCFKLKT